jgi:hypothetical protein
MALPPQTPLVIEDGSGVAGADSFITVAELDAIASKYFNAPAHDGPASKKAALRRSFLYLKSLKWRDEFPTFDGTVPDDVKLAQGVLAFYEGFNPNGLAPSVVPGQQKVLNRVGEIVWQVTGSTGVDAQRAVVTMAQDLLAPFLLPKTNFLLRA